MPAQFHQTEVEKSKTKLLFGTWKRAHAYSQQQQKRHTEHITEEAQLYIWLSLFVSMVVLTLRFRTCGDGKHYTVQLRAASSRNWLAEKNSKCKWKRWCIDAKRIESITEKIYIRRNHDSRAQILITVVNVILIIILLSYRCPSSSSFLCPPVECICWSSLSSSIRYHFILFLRSLPLLVCDRCFPYSHVIWITLCALCVLTV